MISGPRGSSLTGLGGVAGSVNDPAPAEDSATHSGCLDDWLHTSMTDCSTQWRTPGLDQICKVKYYQEGKSLVQLGVKPGDQLNPSMFAQLSRTSGHE